MKSVQAIKVASLTILLVAASFVVLGFSPSLTAPSSAYATTTTTGLELSPQPIYEEVSRQAGENRINDTHAEITFTASGNLTLPNATTAGGEPIRITSRGSVLISFVDDTAIGEQVITTTEGEEGGETAVAKFFEIARFNMEQEGTGRSIIISVVHTNSTGVLAPLNGMILVGQEEFNTDGTSTTTLWEWNNGIPLPPMMPSTTDTNTTTSTLTQ